MFQLHEICIPSVSKVCLTNGAFALIVRRRMHFMTLTPALRIRIQCEMSRLIISLKSIFLSILIIKNYICTLFNNLTINYQNNLGWIYYLGSGYIFGINQFIGKCYNDISGLHIIIIFNYRSYIILWFIWWFSLCASF